MDFFDFFQIIYFVVICILIAGRTAFLRMLGITVFVLGSGKSGFRRAVEMGFFVLIPLLSIEIIIVTLRLPYQFLPDVLVKPFANMFMLRLCGVTIEIAGLVLLVSALMAFGLSWRVGIDNKNPGSLVTGGVFALSRNPIFLSVDLFFIGLAMIYSNLFFFIAAASFIIGVHCQIVHEEQFLMQHYGESYLRYMQKVPRYI